MFFPSQIRSASQREVDAPVQLSWAASAAMAYLILGARLETAQLTVATIAANVSVKTIRWTAKIVVVVRVNATAKG